MSDTSPNGTHQDKPGKSSGRNPDLDTVRLIVGRINAGQHDAWPKLTEQIQGYLTLMAEKNLSPTLRGQVNPSDIVQQTMIEVVQGIGNFRGTSTPEFYAWLNRILKNQSTRIARDLTRQKRDIRRQVSIDQKESKLDFKVNLADANATPGTMAIARERLDLMEQALKGLPDEYEQVIRLRNLEGNSYDDIAEKMNRSAGAVSKLWYRAMVKLREELARIENETKQ